MALQTQIRENFPEQKVSLFSQLRKEHLLAGIAGGTTSTLLLHPLDLIKIRFAVNEGATRSLNRPQYNGVFDAFGSIYRTEGIRGLYQGVVPNILGAGSAWGLYFFFYNAVKSWLQEGDPRRDLGPAVHLAAATNSGVLTLALTNPIWVVKTRLCLQYDASCKNYHGFVQTLGKIYRAEGVRGWYKGFVPGLFGVSHGALQFMAYEEMKTQYNLSLGRNTDHRLETLEYLAFGGLSKIFATMTTYPYQVLRARLQDQHRQYRGVLDVIRQIRTHEGFVGFYKGLVPNLLRVTPATAITFFVYESIISMFTPKSN
ncbi:unnamed protein product [Notodromas monacha]|uniref:Solute carrier family 25 member 32 n=1 Tax=Notodromas monacha TaxID=399045 RepID=A0A7R9GD67_9CRUS|nr:unnamed protein product [Notodromas monacha]CAG0916847.1 unnamed protein product [Notodromas monacha]